MSNILLVMILAPCTNSRKMSLLMHARNEKKQSQMIRLIYGAINGNSRDEEWMRGQLSSPYSTNSVVNLANSHLEYNLEQQ